jgi:hypothetical protein
MEEYLSREYEQNFDAQCVIDDALFPFGVYFLLHAAQMGREEYAERFFEFLFRKLPSIYPPDKIFVSGEVGDIQSVDTFGDRVSFLRNIVSNEWTLRMELERMKALRDGTVSAWIRRMFDEVGRGGDTITVDALSFFADNLIREGGERYVEDLYRLMIRKSLMQPNEENVGKTLKAIQESPLTDEIKDDLLEGFVARLIEMVHAFRGIDLSIIQRLQGLFPWKTPFMRAHDMPYYPRTEGLVIEKLADIPELTETKRGKDERVRLAAFSAAGLPLQRYARWTEELFYDGPAELNDMGLRKNYWMIYRDLGLPHPYMIPTKYAPDDALSLLSKEGKKMGKVLREGDASQVDAVLRLMGRIIGSELRYLGKDSDDLMSSRMVEQVFGWLKRQYEEKERSPHVDAVREMFFAAGPRGIRRLDQASAMLDWPMSREEKRRVFEQATRHLVFSKRMKKRLIAAQNASEKAEMNLYRLLLSLHYEVHPGNMVSDYLFTRLRESKKLKHAYKKAVEGGKIEEAIILAEIGLSKIESQLLQLREKTSFDIVERLELILNAYGFLREYMKRSDRLDYCEGHYFQFRSELISKHIDVFRPYVSGIELESLDRFHSGVFEADELYAVRFEERMREFAEVLSEAGLAKSVDETLDRMHSSGPGVDPDKVLQEALEKLDAKIADIEDIYRHVIRQELEHRLIDVEIPDFIEEREGLERNLLIWVMESLNRSQREILNRELKTAKDDRDRILALGKAANLEKLMQLGSIHPAVPSRYQKLFSVFQEDMPHRDRIDVDRTIAMSMQGERGSLVVGKPIKEGTIGGVYKAKYEGQDIALKVIPEGKRKDILDSLRLVGDVRRFLWASEYEEPGARAVDDLLAFYERTLEEEIDLLLEEVNGPEFRAILPEGFYFPKFLEKIPIAGPLAMEPVYSRRLKDLDAKERDYVFRRIDEELIPTMFAHGIVHFDFHPGNIGLKDDGTIVLYDAGRMVRLNEDQRATLAEFYQAVRERRVNEIPDLLGKMGLVRDEEAFKNIGELMNKMMAADDPLAALEDIYPKLSNYGYVLGDTFIKVLFMFITWRGTKKSFGSQ